MDNLVPSRQLSYLSQAVPPRRVAVKVNGDVNTRKRNVVAKVKARYSLLVT